MSLNETHETISSFSDLLARFFIPHPETPETPHPDHQPHRTHSLKAPAKNERKKRAQKRNP